MDIRMLKEHPEYEEQVRQIPTRWEKVKKIKKEEDRLRSMAAGILMSQGLKDAGMDAGNCQLVKGAHGKPEIKGQEKVYFNLSHTGNYAVAVFADSMVGIDIERRRTLSRPVLEKCCTKEERYWIQNQQDREMAFVRIWTAKESYVKWTGEGITFPLKDIEIRWDKQDIRLLRNHVPQPVKILEYNQIPDYHICICRGIQEVESVKPEIIWLPQGYREGE